MSKGCCSLLAFGIISPWLLLGGLLLSAAPIVIHLLHRRRHRDQPWGAMQFLRAAVRTQARRVRMESLLLLAVRVLLVAAAACTVAQPFLTSSGTDGPLGGGRVHHMIVIDGSLSMQAGGDDSAFRRARDIAVRIVGAADSGDACHLLRIGRSSPQVLIGEGTFNRDALVQELERLAAGEERGDVAGTLRSALPLLKRAPADHHWKVYILSDFQRADWLPLDADARADARRLLHEMAARSDLTLIDVGAPAPAVNAAIVDVRLQRSASLNADADIEATFRAFGTDSALEIPVELRIDGRLRDTQTVSIQPPAAATVRFSSVLSGGDESLAELRIPDDLLAPDNRRRLVLPPLEPLDVLIVSGEPPAPGRRRAADFLATALAPGAAAAGGAASVERSGIMRPVVIPDGELAATDLAPFDCVCLCDVGLISPGEAGQLQSYVETGGGLIITLGDNVRPASYHEMLDQQGQGLLPARLIEVVTAGDEAAGFRFDPADYAEPLIRAFAGNEDAGLLTTRIDRYYKVEVAGDARPILRFDNGDAAIIERRLGAGRALLVTTAVDDRWGNWALWPSYVPMMHELVRLAGAADWSGRQLLVGDAIIHHALPEDYGRPVTLVVPEAEPVSLRALAHSDLSTSTSEPILRSGPCELRIGATAPRIERYAVNVDAAESDLRGIDQNQLAAELLQDARFRYVLDWRQTEGARFEEQLGRADLTLWFAVATLVLLLVEQLMAWRFRAGAIVLLAVVVASLVAGAGFRGLLGAALLLALAMVLAVRRRRAGAGRSPG